MVDLHKIIISVLIVPYLADYFSWWPDVSSFSVKATYSRLAFISTSGSHMDVDFSDALSLMTNYVLRNIHFFWILLLNRLPTRDQLAKRGFVYGVHNLVCPLCLDCVKS